MLALVLRCLNRYGPARVACLLDTIMTDDNPTVDDYVDIRDVHPDYDEMECWNCGHTERIGPNRHIRVCHHCFIDNQPTDTDTDNTVEGPGGKQYVNYRLLWYGDVSIEEAQRRYEDSTEDVRERTRRSEARNRTVRL